MQHQEFQELKKKVIRKFFARMNPQQFDAVTTVDGAVLIIAGAGSGKTTVMIHRIANMILFGNALQENSSVPDAETIRKLQDYIKNRIDLSTEELRNSISVNSVKPWQILAITFTNKAAEELKNRLSVTLGEIAGQIQASTFHSACVRILRTCSDRIGYDTHFTIYDTDDSLKLLKSCMKELKIPEKEYPPRDLLTRISHAKDKMLSPEEYAEFITTNLKPDPKLMMASQVYSCYQEKMQAADAMDFDDLIYLTVRVFEQNPDVLEKYQNRFSYLMVDEYQDTNYAQYRLISLLAGKYRNLCVVGDDDQSIYKFRGATIENILNFEQEFPDCKVIRLEENYRSTQNILKTANAVIAHNQNRKSKTLWTAGDTGALTHIVHVPDETKEAQFIAD
ncbi:MAG: UvrD-helicase domain-containing protein, partial [Oscillospiraceae bacterium]|nr:UvrD-helicase domain-containing protein [Oscillospiraceae bacterium]